MTSESQEWILRTFNKNKPIFQIFAKNSRIMQFWQFFFKKTAVILLDKAKTEQNKTKQNKYREEATTPSTLTLTAYPSPTPR